MCGMDACNYGCCNSETFHIEFSPKEKSHLEKKYNQTLQDVEYQNGRCSHLNGEGCSFGEDIPDYCRNYPMTENNNGTIVLSNWSWLHCPKPSDYQLEKVEDEKWFYRLKKRHKNKVERLVLDDDIENVVPSFYQRDDMKEFI
mgnify:CR=1 FL=1